MASLTRAAHLACVGCVALGKRSRRPIWRARPAHWRQLPALLCTLATVCSLTLSACTSGVPPAQRTPTASSLPSWCSNGGEGPPPSFGLAASPPVTADGVVYVAYTLPDATHNPRQDTYAVAALRARDGTLLWRVPTARLMSPLAVADGVLIVSFGKLVGLRASDGSTLWRSSLEAGVLALSQGVLYFADASTVSALRLVDGHILWQTPVPGFPIGTPPVADGTSVYVGAGNGSVVALRADTGAIRWTAFQSATASPVVWHYPLATSGGQLYVTASDVQSVLPALLRLNPVDGTNDGYALLLPTYALLLYPALTGDIFTTVISPTRVPPGRADAPAPTINGYRLSATGLGHLLWSVPGQAGAFQPTAHDAQTFYFEALPPGGLSAYRLTDGAVLWREPALASGGTRIAAGSGYLVETMSGRDAPCRNPPTHQAPQIRALTATQGIVAWTRALDALL